MTNRLPRRHHFIGNWGRRSIFRSAAVAATLCLGAAACTSAGQSGGGHATKGGVVTFAERPNDPPNYIFPMFPRTAEDTRRRSSGSSSRCGARCTGSEHQRRPDVQRVAEPGLSAGLFSNGNKTVTIKMKNWKLVRRQADHDQGRRVLDQHAARRTSRATRTTSPATCPDNIKPASLHPSDHVRIPPSIRPISSQLAAHNQRCLLFPMPQHAWDKTSATGKVGNYDQTTAGAKAVFAYLNSQAGKLSTYNSNPCGRSSTARST